MDAHLINNAIRRGKNNIILKNHSKDCFLAQFIDIKDYSNNWIIKSFTYVILNKKLIKKCPVYKWL